MTTITAGQAEPDDVLLDAAGTVWQRGPESFTWSTFTGPVFFYGPWEDSYGPQGDLVLWPAPGNQHRLSSF